jgi:hypothetical protein
MPPQPVPSILLELCSLCPVEPACHRQQMLDHIGYQRNAEADEPAGVFTVKGQPYRCWLLALSEGSPPAA